MKSFLKHHSLVIGLVLMFLYTWTIDLSNSGILPFKVPFPIYITLGRGFIFASLLMTWLTLGKEEMVKLFKRFFICRVGWKWLLAAFLVPMIFVSAVLLNAFITQTPLDFSAVMARMIFGAEAYLPVFILPFFLVDLLTKARRWAGASTSCSRAARRPSTARTRWRASSTSTCSTTSRGSRSQATGARPATATARGTARRWGGTNFADGRGAIMGSVGYYKRSLVTQADRKFSRVKLQYYGPGTGGVGPGGEFLPLGNSNIPEGKVIFGGNRPSAYAFNSLFEYYGYPIGSVPYQSQFGFNTDGSVFTLGNNRDANSVANFRGTQDPLTYNDRAYRYNYAPWQAMQMPLERTSVFVNGTFEFNASAELYAQGIYADYTVDEQLAPTPIPNAYVPVTNPYISPDLRFLLDSRPDPTAPFTLAKRTLELGPRTTSNQYGFYQFAV